MTRRLLILILALASCACNRSRNIPDDELVAITRDIFLSNAFRESLLSGIPMTDSVDIYTPISRNTATSRKISTTRSETSLSARASASPTSSTR